MVNKKKLGQFFTTNSDYIFRGLSSYIENKEVIDPFAGNQDLINWSLKNNCKKVIGFDCDKKYIDGKKVFYNDSINNPQKYKFVCTNPPYLHKNKADQKTKNRFFSGNLSSFEDLYQISIFSILNCEEGILIVPLNFLCAENSKKIRDLFFDRFKIVKLNIFSEQVFNDTTYNVISFYFKKKNNNIENNEIIATIFPENKRIHLTINKKHGWQFGGDFVGRIKKTKNNLGVFRLTEDYLSSGEYKVELAFQNIKDKKLIHIGKDLKKLIRKNILILRAIDSKNGKKIQLEDIRQYGVEGLIGKKTSRNMAHLIFKKELPLNDQIELMEKFNSELNQGRSKYFSFFLTNFRDNSRKRISFNLTYKFLNYIYEQKNSKQPVLF